MTRASLSVLAITLLAACVDAPTSPSLLGAADGPSLSASSSTSSEIIPIDLTVFVPCAAGGAGELVALEGNLHVLLHTTTSSTGNVSVKTHAQPQGISGTGLTTGVKYQATGVTQDHTTSGSGGLPFTFTYVNNFRIIGQGPGNNLLVHENVHVTVNANGDVTTEVDNFSIECR
ncbi:MAG TPA: hypothetical protein VFS05_05485 [Gemmatimonadaceae bacterium]|nr:hypothetical protein [Gemmatimonadaceae bacterium]